MISASRRGRRKLVVWAVIASLTLLAAGPVKAQLQMHSDHFEQKIGWMRSGADAPFEETLHEIGDQAQDGLRSEHLQLTAKAGNFIYYQYNIGQAVLDEDFHVRVWVKANRPGIRLMARVILPNESESPKFIENKLSTLVPGDEYRNVGHWQQLTIPRPTARMEEAKRALQRKDQLNRPVNFKDAYVDALVLNVYGGPGHADVWIDNLEVGPVSAPVPAAVAPGGAAPRAIRNPFVKFDGTQLFVGDRKFCMRGIRRTDTPLRVLHDAGFNTVFMDAPNQKLVKEASDLGFWLVPQLHSLGDDPRFVSQESQFQEVNRFADNDTVLFWNLGDRLTRKQADSVAGVMRKVQAIDGGRYFGGDVNDGTQNYSRHQNFLVGNHRFPLFSSLELLGYRDWLDHRRRVAHPGAYMWTWIQTHMPDEFTQQIYDRDGHDGFNEAVGPQPEQIRLLTYIALAAGYKGLGYWSDRWLADSHHGRDRLLTCALLNQELDMLEPILMNLDEPPQWIDTPAPDVKAAIIRTARGALVLPVWMGKGSQFVPGQAALGKLSMIVPHMPQTMQAFEVNPADVRRLPCERVVGGTRVNLSEFAMTSAIFFTADTKLIDRLKEQAQANRQLAAQWSFDLALYELIKIRRIHDQLVAQGQSPTESEHLLVEAQKRLASAQDLWNNHNFRESYHESQRALRPVRILMRQHWDRAVKGLDTPVASPYAVSFYSLPRHWQFMDYMKQLIPTANALPGGDFEIIQQRPQEAWHFEETLGDDVEVSATRTGEVHKTDAKGIKSKESPHGGRQCARLQIKGAARRPTPGVVENTRIALVSPTVKLPPGTIAQITAWINLTENVTGSADGAMFYDSVGGEALAVRLSTPTKNWQKFTLFRRVPASGSVYVTLALTGIGSVYFDDVTIEPLVPATNPNITPVRFGNANTPGN